MENAMEFNATQVRGVVEHNMDRGNPVMISGAPGIGKSDTVRQIAASRGWKCISLLLSTKDAVELHGLPFVANGKACFAPLDVLPNVARDGENGILFLDELTQASTAVQNAAMPLALEGKLGAYTLPAGWHAIAAGNRIADRAGSSRMQSALANRFAHVTMTVDCDAWCRWAIGAGLPAELVAFIRFRPELLHQFDPDRLVNATPRTWAMLARHVATGLPRDLEIPVFSGLVGMGPTAELIAFLRIWRNLPSPDSVFLNPQSAVVPADSATLYALCGAIARKVTIGSMGAFVDYLERLPAEYGVLAMKDATRRDATLEKCAPAIAWFAKNSDVYI